MRRRTTAELHVSAAMSVAADVFVPFFFNSLPQLLQINAPLANALGEVKIMRDNEVSSDFFLGFCLSTDFSCSLSAVRAARICERTSSLRAAPFQRGVQV